MHTESKKLAGHNLKTKIINHGPKPKLKPKVNTSNSPNISKNQNYAACQKIMDFCLINKTHGNVCFDKNQTQTLVEIKVDPPKTGSVLATSKKIGDTSFWWINLNFNQSLGLVLVKTYVSVSFVN